MAEDYRGPPAPNVPQNNNSMVFSQTGGTPHTLTTTGGGTKKTGSDNGAQDRNKTETKEIKINTSKKKTDSTVTKIITGVTSVQISHLPSSLR